jgi:hypothetical protein
VFCRTCLRPPGRTAPLAIERRPSDRGADRCPPAVFAPEVQNRKRFRTADDPSVGTAAFRTDLALGGRNFGSAALLAPLCLDGIWLHRCTAHHIESRCPCAGHSAEFLRCAASASRTICRCLAGTADILKTLSGARGIRSRVCPLQKAALGGDYGHNRRPAHDLVNCCARRDRGDCVVARKPLIGCGLEA